MQCGMVCADYAGIGFLSLSHKADNQPQLR